MTERPILFSAPMVRAILDGRKTMTRRVVKNAEHHFNNATLHSQYCPYGQPGDRLWIRETFMDLRGTGCEHRTKLGNLSRYAYAAESPPGSYSDQTRKDYGLKWTPSIHMPRIASRITLEITAVRVERLQDIRSIDAELEGVVCHALSAKGFIDYFRELWESINGPGSWALNPWVWVIEFRRVTT